MHTQRAKSNRLFGFIKHLQGSHKGQKVKDLHKLKSYLKSFGYLDYQLSKNQPHANDDDFDDALQSAIKTYQKNYHLNVTGTLDAQTVSMMTMWRCGVPDIVNGTNWMSNDNETHHDHGSTFIHTVSHYTFFPGEPKWPPPKTHLTYAFYPNTNPRAISPVSRAFNRWGSATRFSFSRARNLQTADLKVGFFRRNHGDGNSFDGRGGTLAHAFAPTDGRFHYDADESWSVGPVPGSFDMETVALHEIGHLLGLGHSSVRGAIMWPSIAPGSTKGLHADDIQGIKALYK